MIDNITTSSIENRLGGTIAIHLRAIDNGADIIRCHDVFEHFQAFKVINRIDNYN
jgi:dihydropteroate synthase